jgi:CheY-like chemotaxis protein
LCKTDRRPLSTRFTVAAATSGPATDAAGVRPDIHALLVEDNPINRLVASEYLKRAGCDVDLAMHGREAVERCRDKSYDIIFMDCQMPEMDGFEATRAIREAHSGSGRRVPIVALTASAMVEDRAECAAAGMDDCVVKPVNQDLITGALRRWVPRTHRAMAEAK